VILVRHSQPDIQPALDPTLWRLTHEGRKRCYDLAHTIAMVEPDAIFSSPEVKTVETAAILAQVLQLPHAEIAELAEHDRAGVPFFSTQQEFEDRIAQFFAQRDLCVFGNESAVEALARFTVGVERAAARAARPVVVTHGTVMALYLARLTGADPLAVWRSLATPCYAVCWPRDGLHGEIQYVGAVTSRAR
jgi:broad specificity phosphatase PhoE